MTLLYGGFAKAQLVADVPKIFTLEIMQAEQGFIGIGESTLINHPSNVVTKQISLSLCLVRICSVMGHSPLSLLILAARRASVLITFAGA